MSTDESLIKAEKDFTEELDAQLPEIRTLAKSNIAAALEKLLVLEKQTRQASDLASSKRVLKEIVETTKDADKDWALLNEQVQLLSKKHGQLKTAIGYMIQSVIDLLDKAPSEATKIATIENIRTVTEGKIFVETERARVTLTLAKIREAEGDIATACDILCELQVETYGSMDQREKTEFILKQVELCILKGDFTQALILSRKILVRYFESPDVQDLKLIYYDYMIKISLHDHKYLDVAQHYLHVYDTPSVVADAAQWKPVLTHIVYYLVLAPFDNLESDLLHKINLDHKLQTLPLQGELVKNFIANELMRWPKVEEVYGKELRQSDVFSSKVENGDRRWDDLRKRVIEHNIRVISKYYTRIKTARLTQLLDLTEKETEEFISSLVTQGTIYARINRPERVVTFAKPQDTNDILNTWSANIGTLLDHVESIGHLITKEEMMNGIKSQS